MTTKAPAAGGGTADSAIDAAFAAVLAAEREAEAAVAACRGEADRRLAEAEAGARRLAQRAAARRDAWRERQLAALAPKLAALEREAAAAAEPVSLDDAARARLMIAVEALADELCREDGQAG